MGLTDFAANVAAFLSAWTLHDSLVMGGCKLTMARFGTPIAIFTRHLPYIGTRLFH
jgi:hypothetical protein